MIGRHLILAFVIGLCSCTTPQTTFSVSENTSPFPEPGFHLGHGAKTTLHADFSCPANAANGGDSMLLLTGADQSYASEIISSNGGSQPIFVSASQDEIYPANIMVTVRIADSAVRGILPVGGQASVVVPTGSCPTGEKVALNDTRIPVPKTPGFRAPIGLTPFPAEKQ